MELKIVAENHTQQNNPQVIARNLHELLRSHNITINQLAHALGIPMMTVRRLLSGETTDPRISTLKLIADYFNVSVDFLIEENKQTSFSKKTNSYLLPKLNWQTAEKNTSINNLDLSLWNDWQSISLEEKDVIGNNAFALESRPSMYPRFPQGTIFIIDPDAKPRDGDIILIKLKNNSELTLRELTIDPPEWKLHPVVVGSSSVLHYFAKEHEIIGINVLTMLYTRKI